MQQRFLPPPETSFRTQVIDRSCIRPQALCVPDEKHRDQSRDAGIDWLLAHDHVFLPDYGAVGDVNYGPVGSIRRYAGMSVPRDDVVRPPFPPKQ